MKREELEPILQDAEDWCLAEGCEGADYLRGLIDTARMSHYSQWEERSINILLTLIELELIGWQSDARVVENYNEIKGNPNHVG